VRDDKRRLLLLACIFSILLFVYFFNFKSPRSSKNINDQSNINPQNIETKNLAFEPSKSGVVDTEADKRTPSNLPSGELPTPKGPEGIEWKVDFAGAGFASFQAFKSGLRVWPYELRYEKINSKWELLEGISPPADSGSLKFPNSPSLIQDVSDKQPEIETIQVKEKLWWVDSQNLYKAIVKTEVLLPRRKKEYWYLDANSGEVLKKVSKARH